MFSCNPEPATAPLFDTAYQLVRQAFGPDDQPVRITLSLRPLRIVIDTLKARQVQIDNDTDPHQ